MKRLRVFWRNSPRDLDVLQVVEHIRFGPDGEEVLTTDQGAEVIRAMSREFAEDFWIDEFQTIDPHQAVDYLRQHVPAQEFGGLLRRLIALVSKEDEATAQELFEQWEATLKRQG
ncbi:MAG: hypothetical protein NZ951_02770 [Dehalococcoidia bacterium]|nr:hypothetical protein [Dehalococcoidia bacterium]MDW8120073.1 hypothetical protein [Chloroflexota bacterium]